uniref:Ribosomal protein L29 n=1 Tax=Vischeria sp. CAUP Q 202 TaxID=1805947 RepID=A0A1D8RDP9_9STRA|nr:ribosomal protein L29 [Vischeria punctata]AOW70851.1 ribosomal protein L29 [Vischeria sp. CAUP Q 202]UTV00846.1 ribosomal protein L29 [Vischeria punctata]
MSFPKFSELKEIDITKIDDQIIKAKKELLFLRIQKANFSRFSPHLLTHTKHQLSQLLTLRRSLYAKKFNAQRLKKKIKKKN